MKIFSYLLLFSFCFPYFALAATTWTENKPTGTYENTYFHIASDSTGQNLIAGNYGVSGGVGRLYTSNNYGADNSWTEVRPNGLDTGYHWIAVASDSDGSNLLATISSLTNGAIWVYSTIDSVAAWRQRNTSVGAMWFTTAESDSDGSVLLVGGSTASTGNLYLSVNSGVDWSPVSPTGAALNALAVNSDGSMLLAGKSSAGRLYVSTNLGGLWTDVSPVSSTDQNWREAASDSTGTHLIAGANGGRLWISDNSGGSWSEANPTGVLSNQNWRAISSDATGQHLIAGIYGGGLYTSDNYGATWSLETQTEVSGNKNWSSSAQNSDGTFSAVATFEQRIYTGVFSSSVPEFNLTMFTVLLTIGSWFMYKEIVPIIKNDTGVGRLV